MSPALPLSIVVAVLLFAPVFVWQGAATNETVDEREAHDFYRRTGRRPVWIDAQGRPSPEAWAVLAHLRGAEAEGLEAEDYRAAALEAEAMALEEDGARSAADAVAFDAKLTTSALRFLRELHLGRLDPREVGFDFDHIIEPHDFPGLLMSAATGRSFDSVAADLRPKVLHYDGLRQMLMKYQNRDPVKARKIALAMERLRWLPELTGEPLIVVNIPMFHVWGWDPEKVLDVPAIDMAAIIGRADKTRTPVFSSRVTEVVLNPSWNVPESIVQNEILPALRRDRNYLVRNHMEMISEGAGRRIRQRPGPWNALGRIKFEFPNRYTVYLHGTPARQLFRRTRRDFSHGCIRVEDPVALAEWILSAQGEWSRPKILAAIGEGRTRTIRVAGHPPRIVMLYSTAMALPGEKDVRLADDIYGHDARLDAWLKERAARLFRTDGE